MIDSEKGAVLPMWPVYGYGFFAATAIAIGFFCAPLVSNVWQVLLPTLTVLSIPGVALVRAWQRGVRESFGGLRGAGQNQASFFDQYDSLTGNSNDIILLVAEDGTIVKANDRAATAYGYERNELERLNIRSIRAPQTLNDLGLRMQQVMERGGLVFETEHRRKGGESFPVEASSRILEVDGKKYFQSTIRDITERKKAEHRLTRLNECFLKFGADPLQNINALVGLCGELLGATTALYNRLEGGFLCSIGQWNTPDKYEPKDKAEGHLCYELIRGGQDSMMVVRDLPATGYFTTDPNVREYGLRTYVGKPVRFGDQSIGALCAVFTHDFVPRPNDERLISIIAAAIGVEENRRHKEEELRESEERYRRLVDLSPDAIAVHVDGRFVFVNQSGLRLIGAQEMSELVGKPILDIVHPDYKELVEVRALAQRGHPSEQPFVEEKFVRFDGSVVDVEVATIPIAYGGEPATLVVARGLEDRKRAEEELLKLRKAVQSSGEIIFTTNADGIITYINPEFTRIYGFTAEEIVGKVTPRVLKSGIIDQTNYDLFWGELLQKRVFKGELTNRTKDGRLITVEGSASPILGDKGAILGYLAVQRDITERKQVEDALRKSEASYRGLFNSVVDAIYIQDKDGRFLDVNQGAVEMYGYPREFFIGRAPVDLAAPGVNDLDKTLEALRKTFAGEPQQFEWWGKRKNGEVFPKEMRLNRSEYFGQEVVVALGQDITNRKRAEEDVRRSEIRFRRVWESSMDGMRILDKDGSIVMVNEAFCRLMGKPESQLIGKPYTTIYESLSVEQDVADLKVFQDRFATRSFERHQEVELPLEGGKRILVELSNSLLEIPGEPPLLLSIFRDMTERRAAEQKLRESEEKFRSVAEQSPNMIYINKGGNVVYVNQRCVDMMGYTKEEFYAPEFNFINLIAPEYAPLVLENFSKHKAGGEIPTYEYVLFTKDRKRIVGLHTTRVMNFEGGPAILGIVTDVTEHRHTEEELRKLHRAVEQSPSSIVITDAKGTIEYVNPKFTEVTGYTFEEAKGQNPRILKSGQTTAEEYTKLWETILSGKEWRGEFYNRKKNGEQFCELASISPVRDSSGTITHFLAVKEDITQRKLLEQQLFHARKMESLGTLASGIAHDFNNILGIILGYASMLKEKYLGPEKSAIYLDSIVKAADRGAGLVRQILTFARKSDFKLELVDVNSIIGELTTMLGETFPKTISLSLQLEKALPPLPVDRTQVHQALLNLCVNARDAMADHGSISIATRLVQGKSLSARFAIATNENYVEISVSDTGSGIDETTKARIFEPFFTTKEIGKGTGLGLSVVFGVVEAHQGFVDVDSELGRGSTFRVYLPLPQGSVIAGEEGSAGGQDVRGGSETVLVVEDEELMLGFVVTVLERKGYRALVAHDGEEAVELYATKKNTIDLVLSDFGLPKLDGWEACLRMKELNPAVKVVLASGYLDPRSKSEILKGGIAGFIGKPYSPYEILRAIRVALDS
ncbi:MAG: PAS domain S-box protein [Bacteroidota bacterium]|jgi:PAS domain S-box-containing protein